MNAPYPKKRHRPPKPPHISDEDEKRCILLWMKSNPNTPIPPWHSMPTSLAERILAEIAEDLKDDPEVKAYAEFVKGHRQEP